MLIHSRIKLCVQIAIQRHAVGMTMHESRPVNKTHNIAYVCVWVWVLLLFRTLRLRLHTTLTRTHADLECADERPFWWWLVHFYFHPRCSTSAYVSSVSLAVCWALCYIYIYACTYVRLCECECWVFFHAAVGLDSIATRWLRLPHAATERKGVQRTHCDDVGVCVCIRKTKRTNANLIHRVVYVVCVWCDVCRMCRHIGEREQLNANGCLRVRVCFVSTHAGSNGTMMIMMDIRSMQSIITYIYKHALTQEW